MLTQAARRRHPARRVPHGGCTRFQAASGILARPSRKTNGPVAAEGRIAADHHLMKSATTGISSSVERRALWGGVALWLLFCVAAVCVRGVRWEETYERAQVLLGVVSYPAGHPLFRYAHNAFTAQYYLSALLLRLVPGPAFVCGFRDVLFLAARRRARARTRAPLGRGRPAPCWAHWPPPGFRCCSTRASGWWVG